MQWARERHGGKRGGAHLDLSRSPVLLDALEELFHGQHHDAGVVGVAKHGMRFARARRLFLRVG